MRSIRILGLGALALLALSVLPATAAASGGFVADQYPATMSGVQQGNVTINNPNVAIKCETFDSSATAEKPAGLLSSSLSATCNGNPIEMGSCKIEFARGSNSFGIGPSGCGPAKLLLFDCEMSIPAQSGLAATYENTGSGTEAGVQVKLNASNIKYTTSKLSFGCGNAGSYENLVIKGTVNITGKNAESKATGIYAYESSLPVGMFMSTLPGQEIESGLYAQSYPASIAGSQTATFKVLSTSGWFVKCTGAQFAGVGLAAQVEAFGFSAAYSGCAIGEEPAEVHMNGCRYEFSKIRHEGGAYRTEHASLGCANPGEGIEIKTAYWGCEFKIPPQSLSGTEEFTNAGAGSSATVSTVLAKSSVQYEALTTSEHCTSYGTGGTGSIPKTTFALGGVYTG